jgi:hypothetical protein
MQVISISSVLKSSAYWTSRVGIRWVMIISAIALWGVSRWLRNEYAADDSNLWLVMDLFLRLSLVAIAILFLVSLLSALVVWAILIQNIRNRKITLDVKFGDGQKAEAGWVPLTVLLRGSVVRPLLGTIHASLVFTEKRMSTRVLLDENLTKPREVWRYAIRGTGQTLLHDRGIYDVENVLISVCDMLGLLSLPCTIPMTQQLYTLPQVQRESRIKAQPNATEEQTHRIDIPKRVEGEYVNYKEFEYGDNIQRIVWKIYAKSGQLVVRVPETKDPYASHLYFYASYFNGLSNDTGAFETELLNVYKDQLRNLYEAIERNGYEVRMPQDQEVPKLAGLGDKKIQLFQIAAASWQHQLPPTLYVKPDKAAFVCLSTLTPYNEIEWAVKQLPASVPLVIIKLSEAIPSPFKFDVKDIFFKPEGKPSDKLRQPWMLSSLRKELIKNEKLIASLLRQRDNSWLAPSLEFERAHGK